MPKRTPEELWRAAAKEAADDERDFQDAAGRSVADAEKALEARGLDPAAERVKAGEWRRELGERVAARKAAQEKAQVRPARRAHPALTWLVAASLGAGVGGSVVYTSMLGGVTAPAPRGSSTAPEPERAAAADLRRDAVAACDAQRWGECLARLDAARSLDPAGDATAEAEATRRRAMEGLLRPDASGP